MIRPPYPFSDEPEPGRRPRPTGPVAAVLIAGVVACTTDRAAFPTVSRLSDERRRTDGVAMDPASRPPAAVNRARAEDGIVVLRAPLGRDAAVSTVRSFFDAVVREDLPGLSRVTSPTAIVRDTRGRGVDRTHNLGLLWQQRFARFDFTALNREALVRESDIDAFDRAHLLALPVEFHGADATNALGPDDVVLRVRVLGQTTRAERLFGDSLTFWLQRVEDRFVIIRIAEALPL